MSDMEKAYRLAAAAVRRRFGEQRPELLKALDRVRAEEVAVFAGVHDSVQEVLARLGTPRTMDPERDLKELPARLIFVNCGKSFDAASQKRLVGLVEAGAWLVTSDWALMLVQDAFPGMVQRGKGSTGDEVVTVEPDLDSLWSDVVVLGADPQWWLEGASYPIQVLNREKVRVEAASHELLRKYGEPAVAVSFNWGAGRVFHVISHFWLKRSRMPGERYAGPCTEFLKAGMRLSDAGVEEVLRAAKVRPEEVNFAAIQSAGTSTELIAQLCARAAAD